MKKIAVIGDPVSHSLSPVMQNTVFRYLCMDYEYGKIELKPYQLKDFCDLARDEYAGFNVTVPYKTEILKYLDQISPESEFSESVNLVLSKGKKLYGYSTDGYGFERAIIESFNIDIKDERFFFIGCGGASKAVITHLLFLGVKEIIIANRTESGAEEFAVKLHKKFPKSEVLSCGLNPVRLSDILRNHPIIVQATSLGLKKDDQLPFNPDFLGKGMRVFDMIYKDTEFFKEAKKRECIATNGLLMLLHQGAKSFEIWTERKAPVDVMKKALLGVVETKI